MTRKQARQIYRTMIDEVLTMRKIELFDTVEVIRDTFGKFVSDNEAKRKEEINTYKARWKPGKELNDKIREVNSRYDELRQNKKDSLLFSFDEGFEKTVAHVKGRVLAVDSGIAKHLRELKSFPVTAIEFQILVEKYGNTSYWANKALKAIAEQNNITYANDLFNPDADEIINVITELRGRLITYMDKAGDGSYEEVALLHPSQLKKLEDRLVIGQDPGFSPEKQARRLLTDVASKRDVFNQANAIKNILATVPDGVRKKFLLGLEAGWSNILDDAIRVSGADELIDVVNKAHVKDMKAARAAVDELRQMDAPGDWYKAASIIARHGGANSEMAEAIKEAFPENNTFQDVISVMSSSIPVSGGEHPDQSSTV